MDATRSNRPSYCGACGTRLGESDAYCGGCGSKTGTSASANPIRSSSEGAIRTKPRRTLVIVLGILALAAIGVVGLTSVQNAKVGQTNDVPPALRPATQAEIDRIMSAPSSMGEGPRSGKSASSSRSTR